eukprot:4033609-Pyramimonas_sp.AAC.1
MTAYGCVWPCASNVPSPKHLTYGRAHTWDPAYSAKTPHFPSPMAVGAHTRESPKSFFSTPMAVYGRAH